MNNRTKILFVAPSAYPLGGVAVWLNYIANGLSALGWKVIVGLVNGKHHQSSKYLNQYSFENVELIDNPSATRYGRVAAISKVIKKTNADLVLSVNVPDVFDAVALCKKSGQPLKSVMTLHGLESDYFQDILAQEQKIDAVISTNMLTKSMVVEYSKFSAERTFYAPYGVSIESELLFDRGTEKLVLLYAGRIEQPQKRCRDLLLMVKEMERRGIEYEFLIAGDGPDRAQLITDLLAVTKIGQITYLGQLSNQQFKKDILPKADVLILVSEWETGPIIIWEAMAAGVTVLSSRYKGSGAEQALKNNKNSLLFDIGDIDAAVDHIATLKQKGVDDLLRKEAVNLIKSRYSLKASIRSWDLVLNLIITNVVAKPFVGVETKEWPKNGRLEKVFGHKLACKLRHNFRFPAYTNCAGDEWPHSNGVVDAAEHVRFYKTLHALESGSSD